MPSPSVSDRLFYFYNTMAKDYRKIYEQHTDRPIPNKYDIHHINKNREDNRIINLVALPESTHREYHQLCRSLPDSIKVEKFVSNTSSKSQFYTYENEVGDINKIIRLDEVRKTIMQWVTFRDVLLGFTFVPECSSKSYNQMRGVIEDE